MINKQRDNRWSQAVKKNYRRCPHCGKQGTGGAHHIIPRGNLKTRYVKENGILTCIIFHRQWEDKRNENKFTKMYVGIEKYKKLKELSVGKITLEESGFEEIK